MLHKQEASQNSTPTYMGLLVRPVSLGGADTRLPIELLVEMDMHKDHLLSGCFAWGPAWTLTPVTEPGAETGSVKESLVRAEPGLTRRQNNSIAQTPVYLQTLITISCLINLR